MAATDNKPAKGELAKNELIFVDYNIAKGLHDVAAEQASSNLGWGVQKSIWVPVSKNNKGAAKIVYSVQSDRAEEFCAMIANPTTPEAGAPNPLESVVQSTSSCERFSIDFELGYGGGMQMKGSAMLIMRATLGGTYEEWKKEYIVRQKELYPGSCKAFGCHVAGSEGVDSSVVWVVLFDNLEIEKVKLSHDASKPSVMRDMIDDGILKDVVSLEWHVVSTAYDYNNIGGEKQDVQCVGRMLDPLTSKIAVAMESLGRSQETFEGTCRFLIEAEFEGQVKALTEGMSQVAKNHLRVHVNGPIVIVNGKYLGSIREFESYVGAMYKYKDTTPDGMYTKRAAKALAAYMQQKEGKSEFCYMDLYDEAAGQLIKPRVIFELYKGLAPKTTENFLALCEEGYAGSSVHRVVKKGWLQMGAIGDKSIWGDAFEDETFSIKHMGAGDLGMANSGPHTNASQFYVSLDKLDWLDGKKVVFGRVVDGIKAIRQVARCEVQEWNQRPTTPFTVSSSGKLRMMDVLAPKPRPVPQKKEASGGSGAEQGAETLVVEEKEEEAVAPEEAGEAAAIEAEAAAAAAAVAAQGGDEATAAEASAAVEKETLHSANDFDDQAVAAALKIQTVGRGRAERKRARMIKQEAFKSDALSISTEAAWAVISDFAAPYLVHAGLADKVEVTYEGNMEKKSLGAKRNIVPKEEGKPAAEHTLISNNSDKMMRSEALSGSRGHLAAIPVADATLTWKVKAEEEACVVSLTFKYIEKEATAADVPAYLESVKAVMDAAVSYAVNPPSPAVEEPPAAAEGDAPAEGEAAAPAEGEADPAAEGDAPAEGEAAAPAEGEADPPAE